MDIKYLPQMADKTERRYLFVAIDRATRWVYVAIKPDKTAASARDFLNELHEACPIKITKLLTDNGKEFTDRLFGSRDRRSTGEHEFDQLCSEFGIEHRLTKPRIPQTNGMVERFNGRIAEVLATRRYNSAQDLETTLLRYVWIYNEHLPQKALKHQSPMAAMEQWYSEKPDLFVKSPRNRPEPDSHVIPFFAFPPQIRRVVYTTNAIGSVNSRLRKIIKTRGHFPSDEAATKLLWLALRNITLDWGRAANDWKEAMTQFAILYGERFTKNNI